MGRWIVLLFFLVASVAPVRAGFSTVVIDAGHGGHDRGGIPGQRTSEKDMTLDVARRVRSKLRDAGLRTVMSRDGDYFVPLATRVAIAGRQRNAVFVSIHFNSTPSNPRAQGIETYYYSSGSLSLAAGIHSRVVAAAGTGNRGLRHRGFYVLRRNSIPAVLCELGFLTTAREAQMVKTASYRDRLAQAVASAVIAASRR